MTTLKWAAGHTISQRCLLLRWAPGISQSLLSAVGSSIISPHTPWRRVPATELSAGPERAVLVPASELLFLFLSIDLPLSAFVQTLLSFTPQLSSHCTSHLVQASPASLLTPRAWPSFFGRPCILFIMHPASSCRGCRPGQPLWFCIRGHLAGNRCLTNTVNGLDER